MWICHTVYWLITNIEERQQVFLVIEIGKPTTVAVLIPTRRETVVNQDLPIDDVMRPFCSLII